jgi:hypothetical protein
MGPYLQLIIARWCGLSIENGGIDGGRTLSKKPWKSNLFPSSPRLFLLIFSDLPDNLPYTFNQRLPYYRGFWQK